MVLLDRWVEELGGEERIYGVFVLSWLTARSHFQDFSLTCICKISCLWMSMIELCHSSPKACSLKVTAYMGIAFFILPMPSTLYPSWKYNLKVFRVGVGTDGCEDLSRDDTREGCTLSQHISFELLHSPQPHESSWRPLQCRACDPQLIPSVPAQQGENCSMDLFIFLLMCC